MAYYLRDLLAMTFLIWGWHCLQFTFYIQLEVPIANQLRLNIPIYIYMYVYYPFNKSVLISWKIMVKNKNQKKTHIFTTNVPFHHALFAPLKTWTRLRPGIPGPASPWPPARLRHRPGAQHRKAPFASRIEIPGFFPGWWCFLMVFSEKQKKLFVFGKESYSTVFQGAIFLMVVEFQTFANWWVSTQILVIFGRVPLLNYARID